MNPLAQPGSLHPYLEMTYFGGWPTLLPIF
jgi:hypothetical protein